MTWPEQRDAIAHIADLSSHRNSEHAANSRTNDELTSLQFRWQMIRLLAAVIGAFGFACLHWLLSMRSRRMPTSTPATSV